MKHGILSTLRQSISALSQLDQTTSTDKVSELLERCYWDWLSTASKEDAKIIEKREVSKGYFPINIQENKSVAPTVLAQLKSLRKKHKK